MIVIADSSALIALLVCNALYLLDALFGDVKVPQEVYDEICVENKAEAEKLKLYLEGKVCNLSSHAKIEKINGLGKGELAAIGLYKQLFADLLLIDDARAKKVAYLNNVEVMGSLGILLLAKQKGLISEVKSFITKLRYSDIFISDRLLDQILSMTNEV